MAESSGPQDEGTGTRRGRKPIRPDPGSGPVALFAHRLWELKRQAGDPSFAEMAARLGAAASKSSLAAAARGSALPTWETTWEFVRVLAVDRLGRDAEEVRREWREHWEQAASPADDPEIDTDEAQMPDEPARSPIRKWAVLAALTASLATGAALIAWMIPPAARPAPRQTAAASPHDDSVFERDVTYPDGTVVRRGSAFTKIWRIRNTGDIAWQGRYLTRMNETPCKAPKQVGIRTVLPGESVDVAVRVHASDQPGSCKIYWKMTTEDGTPLLAAKKPIFLDVIVS